MASSVSSERMFSSAGLTVTKLHNRLKPDAMEAFQCMKHTIHGDTLVRMESNGDLDEDDTDGEELNGYVSCDEDDMPRDGLRKP
jgi:hypothetical protein